MNNQIPTACAYTRILKIARTIAGLEGLARPYLLVNSSGLTPDPASGVGEAFPLDRGLLMGDPKFAADVASRVVSLS